MDTSPQSSTALQLTQDELKVCLASIKPGRRLEGAYSHLVFAYVALGFAQVVHPKMLEAAEKTQNGPLRMALKTVAENSHQMAIIKAAGTYDQAGSGANSLANSLDIIGNILKNSAESSSDDRNAARQLVKNIRESVILEKSDELKIVQYWRNKYAAHSSVEPGIDPWAKENPPELEVIESALEQMRSAYHEFALLISMLPETKDLVKDAARIDDTTSRFTISLEGITAWSTNSLLELGRNHGQALLEAFKSGATFV
ncbi:hypothetical protein IR132_08450 [Micrococcus yunnanensis]|uniref:AbiU2 domain-containing protein n=1 Tax=Micrococcus yunnanensis TaxID=566027 RepID=UPI001072941A|nr:hypothetical protein [Micrococcus yunnanensis]MBF0745452.1 hypothetical protein [Micrococcus yunnanensis]TFU54354.1 hypothetical protein E4T95_08435 [Micrococcus yunnanensis]